ncbi:MAG: hypothetical protein M0P77_09130 [Firmicutes bacterium]|nr:hypothetical protein [Bacillota bacterium]
MGRIKQRLKSYIISITLLYIFLIILYIKRFKYSEIDIRFVFALLHLVVFIVLILFLKEYKRYRFALLIIENKIFDIQAVKEDSFSDNNIEFIISCFGILLGRKIIKFNVEGVKLEEVKISDKVISITYGKDKKSRNIKLLHGTIENKKIKEIAEKFQFETGINPLILD